MADSSVITLQRAKAAAAAASRRVVILEGALADVVEVLEQGREALHPHDTFVAYRLEQAEARLRALLTE